MNQPQTEGELAAVRRAMVRGQSFGAKVWRRQTSARLELGYTLRPRGRLKKTRFL